MKPRIDLRVVDGAGLGPDDGDGGLRAVRDPHLGAVQHPAVLGLPRGRDHAAGVRAEVGLGEAEAADLLAGGEQREPVLLLLLGAEGVDRIHHQRALHRGERADAGVAPLELLHDQAVGDVVEPRAAVLLRQVGAEQAQLRHARNQLLGKLALDVRVADDGHEVLVHPGPDGVPDGALLLRQQAVEGQEIHAGELGCSGCGGHVIASCGGLGNAGKIAVPPAQRSLSGRVRRPSPPLRAVDRLEVHGGRPLDPVDGRGGGGLAHDA